MVVTGSFADLERGSRRQDFDSIRPHLSAGHSDLVPISGPPANGCRLPRMIEALTGAAGRGLGRAGAVAPRDRRAASRRTVSSPS